VHGIEERRGTIRSAAGWESKPTPQAVGMMDDWGFQST
jgi:hypothetical protein